MKQRRKPLQDIKAIILSTALDLFSKKGFENTTLQDIAQQANCSEEVLLSSFTSKGYLLICCLQDQNQAFLEAWQNLWKKEFPLEELLLSGLVWLTQHYANHPNWVRTSTMQALLHTEVAQAKQSLLLAPRAQIMLEALESLKKKSKIRSRVDLASFVRIFFSIGFGIGFFGQIVYGNSPEQVEASLREAAKMLTLRLTAPDSISFD